MEGDKGIRGLDVRIGQGTGRLGEEPGSAR